MSTRGGIAHNGSVSAPTPEPGVQFPPPTGTPVAVAADETRVWPKVLFWFSIGLMVVGAIGLVGDWATRTAEMNRLLSQIEVSEAAMGAAKDDIASVELPEDPTDAQEQRAQEELETASAQGRDDVAAAGDEVAAVTFLPWHTELLEAQRAYLAHNRAWVDYLDRGSTEPLTLFGDDNRIEPTWLTAEQQVRAAVPFPPLPTITWQVDEIFRDDEPESTSGGIPA